MKIQKGNYQGIPDHHMSKVVVHDDDNLLFDGDDVLLHSWEMSRMHRQILEIHCRYHRYLQIHILLCMTGSCGIHMVKQTIKWRYS